MIKFIVTFNGSPTEPTDKLDRAIAQNQLDQFRKRLSLYENEINETGGKILINFTEECTESVITFRDFPEEVAQKLKQALM